MSVSEKIRNDCILIASVLAIGVICFILFRLSFKKGDSVNISVDGEIKYSLSLSEDVTEKIVTEKGVNTVVIKDGSVSVTEADCPDKICVSHRSVSKDGETIVCLPHRLVVEVKGEEH